MTATQDDMIAELQRANAELRQDLAARDATLAQRNSEYGERIEHQAATVDVLKAMSASPDDPQPVFDLIVERARDLCDAHSAGVYGCACMTRQGRWHFASVQGFAQMVAEADDSFS